MSSRPPRPQVDPWRLLGSLWEEERQLDGSLQPALTLFLAGAECPFSCVFCDLWRQTTTDPTPPGAIPAQIRQGLAAAGPLPADCGVKLYNASNFFDPRAVPPEDDAEIARLILPFARVTVECHPRLVGRRCRELAACLEGRLEVAMGLETVHPEALPRLGKDMSLDDFDRAAQTLVGDGIGLRVFVLVAPPFVPSDEVVESAVRSVEHAWAQGASRVALIPTRHHPEVAAMPAMAELKRQGQWRPPRLSELEEALDRCLALGRGVVEADLWDARTVFAGEPNLASRLARLERLNRSGEPQAGSGIE